MTITGRMSVLALSAALTACTLVGLTGSAQAGLATCTLLPTTGTVTKQLGDRTYHLNVPPGLTGTGVPLVLSLHGGQQAWSLHEEETGWNAKAAAGRFIVAYPEGNTFYPGGNTTEFLSWDFKQSSPDVTFLRAVVADIATDYCVDPQRVYAEGYSNGAMMAERLACDAADRFAAVAAYAGASPNTLGGSCTPVRPIAVGIFQSLLDPASSYPVGVQNRDEWVARNRCPATPVKEPGVQFEAWKYAPCAGGVEVDWRVYALNSHNWPYTAADKADIIDRIWALFQRNPKP